MSNINVLDGGPSVARAANQMSNENAIYIYIYAHLHAIYINIYIYVSDIHAR